MMSSVGPRYGGMMWPLTRMMMWQRHRAVVGQHEGDVTDDVELTSRREVVYGFLPHHFSAWAVLGEGPPNTPGGQHVAGVRQGNRPSPGR